MIQINSLSVLSHEYIAIGGRGTTNRRIGGVIPCRDAVASDRLSNSRITAVTVKLTKPVACNQMIVGLHKQCGSHITNDKPADLTAIRARLQIQSGAQRLCVNNDRQERLFDPATLSGTVNGHRVGDLRQQRRQCYNLSAAAGNTELNSLCTRLSVGDFNGFPQ